MVRPEEPVLADAEARLQHHLSLDNDATDKHPEVTMWLIRLVELAQLGSNAGPATSPNATSDEGSSAASPTSSPWVERGNSTTQRELQWDET